MMSTKNTPDNPKIYHIVHVDRLPSIIEDGHLWCDAEVNRRALPGTSIGMSKIKMRRLNELILSSHPKSLWSDSELLGVLLQVGGCVPFYFCPRSVMLYVIHRRDHSDLHYTGGQDPVVHLEADLRQTVAWANEHGLRWVFTLSNAGSYHFQDRCDLAQLGEIDWDTVLTTDGWSQQQREAKQAEFLIERLFPWSLVLRIGVFSERMRQQVLADLESTSHKPDVQVMPKWYY